MSKQVKTQFAFCRDQVIFCWVNHCVFPDQGFECIFFFSHFMGLNCTKQHFQNPLLNLRTKENFGICLFRWCLTVSVVQAGNPHSPTSWGVGSFQRCQSWLKKKWVLSVIVNQMSQTATCNGSTAPRRLLEILKFGCFPCLPHFSSFVKHC